MFIDESHVTIGQVGGMYKGDRSRKENLVEYGFRLPSALDNRPLKFEEFERLMPQTVFVSRDARPTTRRSTPGPGGGAGGAPDRPGRPDGRGAPGVHPGGRPCWAEIKRALDVNGERVLVTVLTKRMAEDLTDYLADNGIRVRYCTRTSTPSSGSRSSATCAWASSTCWSASTCCAKAWTSRRCRWWRSSTPTRRASCAPSVR